MEKEQFDHLFYRQILDQLPSNVYVKEDDTDRIVYMNDCMKKTFGYQNPEGKFCWQVLQHQNEEHGKACKINEMLHLSEKKTCVWKEYNPLTDRTYRNYDVLKEWDGRTYHIQYSTDITENLQLSADAAFDELTTLLNRKAGRKRLDETLKGLKDHEKLVVALYDINGLKWVNDTFGHQEGDRLLYYVATNLQDALEETDFMFRLSGDEFIIVFFNKEIYQAEQWIKKMQGILRKERSEAGIEYDVSFCYGLVKIRGKEHLTVSDVLALADTQMYIQKRDYHIEQGKKRLLLNSQEEIHGPKMMEYRQDYLFEAISDIVDGYAFAGNLKTGEFMYSRKMVREFGLSKQVLEEAAAFWGERVHPEDREMFLRSNQEITDGKTERHAIRYRAKNAKGEWIHLLCRGRMIRDEKGDPSLFAGVITNLDDAEFRKNMSSSVASSFYFTDGIPDKKCIEIKNILLEFVNTSIPGGIIATLDEDDYQILCFNQSLLEYFGGSTSEEFLTRSNGKFSELIYEEDRERVSREVKKQLDENHMYKSYYRIMRNDGKLVWIYDVGRYASDANGKRIIISFLIDATEEREKEQELQVINESNQSGVFKVLMTDELRLTYANEGFYRIYGYTKEEAERELSGDLRKLSSPEEMERIRKQIIQAVEAGKKQITLEYQIKRRDGSVGWIHMSAGLDRLSDGRLLMLGVIMDITERHLLEEQLCHTEQLYRFVQSYTKLKVWEFDPQNKKITIQDVCREGGAVERQIENVPESLIGSGVIHENSIAEFQRLHEQISQGQDTSEAVIHFQAPDSFDLWQKIRYIAMKDADGHVKKAVGIAEDVTAQKEAEIRAFNQEKLREIVEKDTLYSVHLNLAAERLEMLWIENERVNVNRDQKTTYQDVYRTIGSYIANENDRRRFAESFSPEKIANEVVSGSLSKEFEFQQVTKSGKIIWVNLTMKSIVSPTTGDEMLFIHARDIDSLKRRELSLQKKAEIDEVTGLYNLGTTKLLITSTLQNRKYEKECESAFLLIDIDNFKEVNRIGGFVTGDELLRQVAERIQKEISPTAIAGRINGDIFAVYFRKCQTVKKLREEIKSFRAALCGVYLCGKWKFDITVSVGAICPGDRKLTYDFIYQNTYHALDTAKRNGGNELVFYSDIKNMASEPIKDEADLSEVFGKALRWIEKGESQREVYRLLMSFLEKNYDAEEVTLFCRKADGVLHREVGWNAYKKGTTLEVREEKLEAVHDVLQKGIKKDSIYVDGADSPGYEELLKVYETKALEYPVFIKGYYENDRIQYGIFIEKCDDRVKETEAVDSIIEMIRWIDYLYKTRHSYERALKDDRNTGLLNYESYISRLNRMNEDSLSSLGMVGIQMVDLKEYNRQYGNNRGDESILFTANLMAELFGRDHCYRVGRTSFFVICENMVYEEFIDRYEKLNDAIEKDYAQWVVTANAWEQTSISAKVMQTQIEEKLIVARNRKKDKNGAVSEKAVQAIMDNIQNLIAQGRFCAYLQPKVDAKTGKVCGAEALVRLLDEKNGIVPPGKFLPSIERAGLIRHIDLFVLESVCKIIRKWTDLGWSPFPISFNYSRVTILEPDILKETNEIVERYGISKDLLEIEITESIGSIDNISLKNIVEEFSDSGYKIALDDYGAEYSNVYALYSLRLNTLKLDRRIVNDIYHDEKAKIVVENVIEICKKFHIQSVAEGVETKEQMEVLKDMSCDMIQGYYINKPLSEREFQRQYIN